MPRSLTHSLSRVEAITRNTWPPVSRTSLAAAGQCSGTPQIPADEYLPTVGGSRGLQWLQMGCQLLWASLIVGGLPIPGDTLAAPPTKLTQALVAPFWRASSSSSSPHAVPT